VTLAFAGIIPWVLLLVLLVALLGFSVPTYWKVLGAGVTALVVVCSLAAGLFAYYLAAMA
jgi:hypothetical protein